MSPPFCLCAMKPRPSPYEGRQARLRKKLGARDLPLLVVSNPANIFYLTGFRGSAGTAVIGPSEAVLWVDPRYSLQAQSDARGVEVIEERGPILSALARWLRKKKHRRVGFEDSFITVSQLRALQREVRERVRFEPAHEVVESLRFSKDHEEVANIREACRVAAAAFKAVFPHVKPGVRESDLAAEIDYQMRRKGAEGPAFETIVASGARGALPHARPTGKLLEKSDLVIFDLGAIIGGYASDMTRTVFLGKPPGRIRRLYNAVLEAQQTAVETIHRGERCCEVDATARRVLERRGLGKYFTHSTGHGVGIDIHEKPRLGRSDKTRLAEGCVVTVEPGVYLENLGGIRLEDTVLVGAQGPEILTPAPMDHWWIS
jgi:Xaa-Pro aminopeptidase